MTSSSDSTRRLEWWRPDPFHATLFAVESGNPRNRKLAELVHVDGGIRTTIKTQSCMDDEVLVRAACKKMEPIMRKEIARWVAKKLT